MFTAWSIYSISVNSSVNIACTIIDIHFVSMYQPGCNLIYSVNWVRVLWFSVLICSSLLVQEIQCSSNREWWWNRLETQRIQIQYIRCDTLSHAYRVVERLAAPRLQCTNPVYYFNHDDDSTHCETQCRALRIRIIFAYYLSITNKPITNNKQYDIFVFTAVLCLSLSHEFNVWVVTKMICHVQWCSATMSKQVRWCAEYQLSVYTSE